MSLKNPLTAKLFVALTSQAHELRLWAYGIYRTILTSMELS